MDDLVPRLAAMSYKAAHNHLMSLDLPSDLRGKLADMATKARAETRKAARRNAALNTAHAQLWHRILAPLKYELSNARVGRDYRAAEQAPERVAAFSAYIELLEKLLLGLQNLQFEEERKFDGKETPMTPAELAEKRGLPNKGAHWSDWVSDKTKDRICTLFDGVPYTPKAKRPEPFQRRVPNRIFREDLRRLQKRTMRELRNAHQELQIVRMGVSGADAWEDIDRLELLTQNMDGALGFLLKLEGDKRDDLYNGVLPVTWHGIPEAKYVFDYGSSSDGTALAEALARFGEPDRKEQKTSRRPKRYRK